MSKYVLIGLIAAVLLTLGTISYFLYSKYKKPVDNKCSDNKCNLSGTNTVCMDDVCTRPEPEKVEPVENTTNLDQEDNLEESE